MKLFPLVLALIILFSCKKKEDTANTCKDNAFPIERWTPHTPKITSVEKNGRNVIIAFQGKITTIYFERLRPIGKIRYIYEVQYDKLCQTSVSGETNYEFERVGPHSYIFRHSVLSSGETNAFQINDWSSYYGKTTLDRVEY